MEHTDETTEVHDTSRRRCSRTGAGTATGTGAGASTGSTRHRHRRSRARGRTARLPARPQRADSLGPCSSLPTGSRPTLRRQPRRNRCRRSWPTCAGACGTDTTPSTIPTNSSTQHLINNGKHNQNNRPPQERGTHRHHVDHPPSGNARTRHAGDTRNHIGTLHQGTAHGPVVPPQERRRHIHTARGRGSAAHILGSRRQRSHHGLRGTARRLVGRQPRDRRAAHHRTRRRGVARTASQRDRQPHSEAASHGHPDRPAVALGRRTQLGQHGGRLLLGRHQAGRNHP